MHINGRRLTTNFEVWSGCPLSRACRLRSKRWPDLYESELRDHWVHGMAEFELLHTFSELLIGLETTQISARRDTTALRLHSLLILIFRLAIAILILAQEVQTRSIILSRAASPGWSYHLPVERSRQMLLKIVSSSPLTGAR